MNLWPGLAFFFLSLSFPLALIAQDTLASENDSLQVKTAAFGIHELDFKETELMPVDFRYHYRPLPKPRLPLARSINIGLPYHSLQSNLQDWGIHFLQGGYRGYIYRPENLKFYKVSQPITILRYTNGSEKEQYFNVFHSQNLGEGLNISFNYDRINSEGFFSRSLTNHTGFYANYNLRSRNRRFFSRGYYAISNLEAQENGGVFLDSASQSNDNPALLAINLFNAQSRSRGREFGLFNQYKVLHFGKDSAKGYLSIFHDSKWNRSWRNFENRHTGDDDFLFNYLLDSVQTADTSVVNVFRNQLGLKWNDQLSLGVRRSDYHYFQNTLIDTNFQSLHLMASWKDSLLGHRWVANFQQGLSGFESEEVAIDIAVSSKIKNVAYTLFFQNQQSVVDYFMLKQRTNQRFENNRFDPTVGQEFGIRLKELKHEIGLELKLQNLQNYIYFDQSASLTQAEDDVQYLSVRLDKRFNFLRHLYLYNLINFQSISDDEIIPLPAFSSFHSLYYQNVFFKQSLKMQFGFDLWVISDYQGYAYLPDNSQFFINPSDRRLGNIQQLDFFINMGITPNGRFFVKMENILSPNYDENNERIYLHPIPGRALKVGLSWKMVN